MFSVLVVEAPQPAYRHTGPQPVLLTRRQLYTGHGGTYPLGLFIFSWSYSWETCPGWSVGWAETYGGWTLVCFRLWTLLHPSLFSWVLSV